MAVSTFNPYGCVQIADGGAPRIITVRAVGNISGGCWAVGSGTPGAATVGSGIDSFVSTDIQAWPATAAVTTSGAFGIALDDIASGTDGAVAMRGLFIMPAGSATALGSVAKGCPVAPYGLGGVIGSLTLSFDCYVGRALTDAGGGANEFAVISLNA